MTNSAAISVEELAALRDQIARQQLLLDEQEAALSAHDAQIALKDKQIDVHEETIAWLQERLNLLLAKRYKHSSEKDNALQISLLDAQELEAAIADAQQRLDEAQASMDKAEQTDNGEEQEANAPDFDRV